jgi:NTP pyrophosphatase (non-canonical NTP hydrolase)
MNQETINEYLQWSEDTFGKENWINVLSKLRTEEVWELREAIVLKGKEEQSEEIADCFLLLFKVAHLTGFNLDEIEKAIEKKLNILKQRKYKNGEKI